MDLGLADRSVLVLAGSKGIGFATAAGFHAEGAKVAICGRDAASLTDAAQALPGLVTMQGDVTNEGDVARIFAETADRCGAPDVLVINAGGPPAGPFTALDDDAWRAAFDLTLMSAIRATRLALPAMKARRWGRIVIISSYGVKQPVPNLTLSNSVRMAVLGWAKTLAGQVAADNILVNTVCPGWTRTGRVTSLLAGDDTAEGRIASGIPLGRLGEADEIAKLAVFLGSQAASYMTGTAIQVDGGLVEGY